MNRGGGGTRGAVRQFVGERMAQSTDNNLPAPTHRVPEATLSDCNGQHQCRSEVMARRSVQRGAGLGSASQTKNGADGLEGASTTSMGGRNVEIVGKHRLKEGLQRHGLYEPE